MGRRKKFQPFKINIKSATLQSVVAIILFALAVLVVISFTGQGVFLQFLNTYLTQKLGLGILFLPFVFIASGLVSLQTKWAWSKPHVLLGTILIMVGVMGTGQSGSIGDAMFHNFATLLSTPGSYVVFSTLIIIGVFIISQLSLIELSELFAKMLAERRQRAAEAQALRLLNGEDEDVPSEQEIKKARGFSIPRLGLGLGKKNNEFTVNDNAVKEAELDDEKATAVAHQAAAKTAADLAQAQAHTQPGAQPPAGDEAAAAATVPPEKPRIWEYPPLSLLSSSRGGEADRGDVKANATIIENTLESFGIKAKVVEVNYGPSVTQYAIDISRGTKLSKVTGLATDLALALAAPTGQIRVEAPIAGRSLVGIEVPNHSAQYVTLRTMLASKNMKEKKSKLAVALGIDVSGTNLVADIAKMPHILIAGATGSGKSVCINAFMCSILFRASPDEVKFILVDPKRVELTGYNGIPHLLTPVIVDPAKVVSALKWATNEMDKRYKKLAEVGVKNIDGYNELAGFAAMPAIVVVIDEMADVMMFAPGEVEECITRLAQMARAVGIHLVLATQRPSVDVITGLIKANIPTRLAFNVSSMADSRVILDTPGAEKLLGKGDMLFIPPDQAKPSRVQGAFVSDQEAKALVDYIKAQGYVPTYEEDITTKFSAATVKGGSSGTDGMNKDDLFDESVKLISQYDKASSSLIQRRLSVGYARAARILDQLYEAGLVGPAEGSKPRDVNVTKIRDYLANPDRLS
jgi:S-DNA-T family DNA segregation ATPase FtsK/SpoIIIE